MPGKLTPRNQFPYPEEEQKNYFATYEAGELAKDSAHWAHAENDLLTFRGGGTIAWNSSTGVMSWSSDINIECFTTRFSVDIAAGQITIQEKEVVFYKLPRLITADTTVTLSKGPRINQSGTRLHDLKLFAYREGGVLYLKNGKSLLTGESGILFGGGVSAVSVATATSGSGGATQGILTADEDKGLEIASGILEAKIDNSTIQFNGSGQLVAVGGGVVSNATSASGDGGTLGITRADSDEGLSINGSGTMSVKYDGSLITVNGSGELTLDETGLTGPHQHLSPITLRPTAGTTTLNSGFSDVSSPSYQSFTLYRNGLLQHLGASYDYTFNSTTGIITLTTASLSGDTYYIDRIGNV